MYDVTAREEREESVAEIHVACRLCRASPSTEAPRRARTGRLLPCDDDAVRRAATDAQVAEAAAHARAAVFMLRLYVVCLVFLCFFQF